MYDFGFYLHQEGFAGGVPEVFQAKVAEVESESAYFLLFGRQLSRGGGTSEVWVEVRLPESGVFSCLDSSLTQRIEQTIQQVVSQGFVQNSGGGATYSMAFATIKGMEVLGQVVFDIKSGNCCVPSDVVISEWLTSEGFVELNVPCRILGPLSLVRPIEPNNRQRIANSYVTDFARLSIEINGRQIILEDEINSFVAAEHLGNSNPVFFITKNASICNGDYDFAKDEVLSNLPMVGGIIYIQANPIGADRMYLRLEGLKLEDVPIAFAGDDNYVPQPLGGAISFQDLVDTIREAEDSLINHGYEDIGARIGILRGIYYGTTWSMDFEQSYGSSSRNNGFKVYLCNPLSPINPEQILGSTLYDKLKRSPEVKNGNIGVDWGHIIIGLEARWRWCSRELNIVAHKSSGLEITTWIGDIGGGAGMLAYRRVANPNKRAKEMFSSSSSDFGGWLNLEGDIAAYIVGRDIDDFDATPSVNIDDDGYVADALEAYLLPQPSPEGSEWNRRGELFLRMLGGKIENGQIVNEESLVEDISSKVEDFAENYVINMAVARNADSNPSNDVNLYETSKYLKGASQEMASIFIRALEDAMNNPNQRVQAQNYNPNPTPAGEPYTKYKAWEGTKNLIKKFEDWIKN